MSAPRYMYLVFLCSGLTGLMYESLWSRYIRLLVGSAATAQVAVLALFMGGLSIGALLAGRWSHRVNRPFVVYGIVEGLVGVYALAFPWLFGVATRLAYDTVLPALAGGPAAGLVLWAGVSLLILPPCVALGATFPLMSVGMLRRDPSRTGAVLSLLYFANSFGAAIGALVTGFVLVPRIGLAGSLAVGGALNLLIAVVALSERTSSKQLQPRSDAEAPSEIRSWLWPLALAVAFGTGLASFMYEVGWIRLLSMILGSATHSFEVMLSAFVLGLALGGLWVRRRIDRFTHPGLTLGIVQLLMGMAAIFSLPLYKLAVSGMGAVFYQEERTVGMWILFNIVRYLMCLLIMLPATFCAGMTLPLLTHWMLRRGASERAIGRVYGLNTLGAIAGAVAAGMFLLPTVGIKGTVVWGAVVDIALGLGLLAYVARAAGDFGRRPGFSRLRMSATIGTVAMVAIAWFRIDLDPRVLASGVFRRGTTELHPNLETVSHVDGRTASITVMLDREDPGYHTLYTNGKPDATIHTTHWPPDRDGRMGPRLAADEPTQVLVGAIPFLARPHARRAAVIGVGSGVTSHTMLASPVLERLDTIEIEPAMARAAEGLGPHNARTFEDPRSHIIFDDAKAYFAGAGSRYDIIVSEPSNPWVSGVSSLFTLEFYAEVKRYLVPGGVLAQWVHGYELSDELLYSILAAVDRAFADYAVLRVGSRDWLILAVDEGKVGTLSGEPLGWPTMAHQLGLLGIEHVAQVDALLGANARLLRPSLRSLVPNRDTYPLLDTRAERARFLKEGAESLLALRLLPVPILSVLGRVEIRDYPDIGIVDDRHERHVLEEPEKARDLLRAYAARVAIHEPGTSEMRVYLERAAAVDATTEDGASRAWFLAVYEVYNQVAPWIDLRDEPWWADVLTTAHRDWITPSVRRAVLLLDAVVRRDGADLWDRVGAELREPGFLLDPRLVTLAGAIALSLEGAEESKSSDFARAHMLEHGQGRSSDDAAYRVVRKLLLEGGDDQD